MLNQASNVHPSFLLILPQSYSCKPIRKVTNVTENAKYLVLGRLPKGGESGGAAACSQGDVGRWATSGFCVGVRLFYRFKSLQPLRLVCTKPYRRTNVQKTHLRIWGLQTRFRTLKRINGYTHHSQA